MQQHLPERREDWTMGAANEEEMAVLARFIDAHQRCDAAAALAIAAEDVRVAMPPYPYRFEGRAGLAPLLERAFGEDREGDWILRPTHANRMPAAVSYLRRPGDSLFRAFKLDVLRIEDGRIREITTFGTALLPAFGLPPTISGRQRRRDGREGSAKTGQLPPWGASGMAPSRIASSPAARPSSTPMSRCRCCGWALSGQRGGTC